MTSATNTSSSATTPQPPLTFFRPGELMVLVEPAPGTLPDGQDMVPQSFLTDLPALLQERFDIAVLPDERSLPREARQQQAMLLRRENTAPLVLHTLRLASWFDESTYHSPADHTSQAAATEHGEASREAASAAPPITYDLVHQAITDVNSAVAKINQASAQDRLIPGQLRILAASPNWLATPLCF